jgi:hypothetical protein
MQIAKVVTGIPIVCLIACTQASDLADQFQVSEYRLAMAERLQKEVAAPVIVAGTVVSVRNIGAPTRSPGDPRILTQLTTIRVDVEHVIKGSITVNPVDFYFFVYSDENRRDLGVPRYIPAPGHRRIYFLKPWADGYRSVGDVTMYNLALWTGTHSKEVCDNKGAGCCIAELLLSPQQDITPETFIREMGPSAYAAGVLCSPQASQQLLERLSKSADTRIAAAASDALSMVTQWWPHLSGR